MNEDIALYVKEKDTTSWQNQILPSKIRNELLKVDILRRIHVKRCILCENSIVIRIVDHENIPVDNLPILEILLHVGVVSRIGRCLVDVLGILKRHPPPF